MSTKFYLKQYLKYFKLHLGLLLFVFELAIPKNSFAWAGYEETTNISIDIPPGNLVRVGREIDIFDFKTNSYHPAEVLFMDDIFSGTRLEVKDFETNEKRIFYMER